MKRLVLAAAAISMLAMPSAFAADGWNFRHSDSDRDRYVSRQHDSRYDRDRFVVRKHVDRKPQWKRGQRLSSWQRQRVVHDYRRYGLRSPGRGQQWVRVGNDYMLVSILSGVIAGIVATH